MHFTFRIDTWTKPDGQSIVEQLLALRITSLARHCLRSRFFNKRIAAAGLL
jgi:hypothetical protein